jgi:hypothetical protein
MPGARFCDHCGAGLADDPGPLVVTQEHREPYQPQHQVLPPQHQHAYAPSARLGQPQHRSAQAVDRAAATSQWSSPPQLRTVVASLVAGLGVVVLLGAVTPYASYFGSSAKLTEQSGGVGVLFALAALAWIASAVGGFLGDGDGFTIGTGMAGAFALAGLLSLIDIGVSDLSPSAGFYFWVIGVLLSVAVIVLLFIEVLPNAETAVLPRVFPACCLGGGILLTLALLIPARGVSFTDGIGTGEPLYATVHVLYLLVPTLIGVAVFVDRTRRWHQVALGVTIWYLLAWMLSSARTAGLMFSTSAVHGGAAHYLPALGLLVLSAATTGGGLVRWNRGMPEAPTTRDLVYPISVGGSLALLLLVGLVVGA